MDCLITNKLNTKESRERFLNIKRSLITEAVAFPVGTANALIKTVVNRFGGIEAAFLKPGKEAGRNIPNTYDMYPLVTYEQQDVTEKFSFGNLWDYLLKIFLIHKGTFKKVLILLYRLCFFYDHSLENGKWRYSPSDEILQLIHNIDNLVLREGFADKFNETNSLTLFQFLLFVDLLAWNEDVKYHASKNEPYFRTYTKSRTGRTNNVLSLISAPLMISKFINDIITKTQTGGVIDVKLITSVIQKFTRSRGLCVLSDRVLLKELAPYLRG